VISNRLRVLYVVYWGALEPLGQSLVLPTILALAREGRLGVTLLTFEKARDLAEVAEVRALEQLLTDAGVRWIRLRYHKRPRVPATVFDIVHGWVRCLWRAFGERPQVVHARTFVGGLIGLPVALLIRARFVYHNEGFYAEEQVDAGFWSERSFSYRLAHALEALLNRLADGVVVLTRRAEASLTQSLARPKPVIVVPSSVDLARFQAGDRPLWRMGPIRFVYLGSIGGRYDFDSIARFVAHALNEFPGSHLTVLSPSDPKVVRALLVGARVPAASWNQRSLPHREVPRELREHDVGLLFMKKGHSAAGGSPTKMGEYWACGLPVVVTPGIGDLDEIINAERVGVIAEVTSPDACRPIPGRLGQLLGDPELRQRCRAAAVRHYSLDDAWRSQAALYARLTTVTSGYETDA
jgi:glycosyltransferase involved in cell wall biosynthesis